jgi:transposase
MSAFKSTGQVLAGESTMEIRTKAVVFYEEGVRSAREIGETYNISERTVRRWAKSHSQDNENGLRPKKTGPKRSPRATSPSLEQRIIRLKERNILHGEPDG